jgi:hypothetical protein
LVGVVWGSFLVSFGDFSDFDGIFCLKIHEELNPKWGLGTPKCGTKLEEKRK